MWDLDDTASYAKVASFDFPWASTYADMRPGHTDKEKRERVRAIAANQLPSSIPHAKWWAFRIFVRKAGGRPFDIENTLKVFIDSFSARQIRSDASQYIVQATFLVIFVNIGGLCGSLVMVVRRYAQRMNRKRLAVFSLVFAVLMCIEVLLCFAVMIMTSLINSGDFGFEYETVMIVAAVGVSGLTFILIIYLPVLLILHLLAMGRTIKDAGQVGSAGRSWFRKE